MNDDELYHDVETEYNKFRRRQAPYDTCLCTYTIYTTAICKPISYHAQNMSHTNAM